MTKEDNLRRAAYKFYRNSYDLPKKEIPSLASGDKLTIEVMTAFATSPAAQEYWKEKLMEAIRAELTEANKMLGIGDKFTEDDYHYVGVVEAAFERLPQPPQTDKTESK